ncbi:hypothetical protein G9A89_010479 [Geosiphon pyriformis]|nr:hypothetical protein G9A89_010479 [Geosiphon pyriformis]
MTNAKVEDALSSKILKIKNNPSKLVDIILISNLDAFLDIETDLEKFYKHYQNLAPTKKEQEQYLKEINTQLCIMSEHIHNTDVEFDLKYFRKDVIKLELHAHICIDLKYILAIEKRVKNQAKIFEVETINCQSEKIGLINLYIPAKSPKHIKIFIYNTTENVIEIPKSTTIGYLSTEMKKMLSAPTKTIGTDELEKSRPITIYVA